MACIFFEMHPDQLGNLSVTVQGTGGCCDLNLQIMVQMGDSKPNPVNVKFSCEYFKKGNYARFQTSLLAQNR